VDLVRAVAFAAEKHRLCVALTRAVQGGMILMPREGYVRDYPDLNLFPGIREGACMGV
jgi:superfamily I DNA and/or RNA helicase